jgi:hypothetical protein
MPATTATRCSAVVALLSAGILFAAPVASGSSLSWIGRGHQRPLAAAWSFGARVGVAPARDRSTTRSCAVDRKRAVGAWDWRLLPVACEQPPRSNLAFQLDWASVAAVFG